MALAHFMCFICSGVMPFIPIVSIITNTQLMPHLPLLAPTLCIYIPTDVSCLP